MVSKYKVRQEIAHLRVSIGKRLTWQIANSLKQRFCPAISSDVLAEGQLKTNHLLTKQALSPMAKILISLKRGSRINDNNPYQE